MEPVPNPVKLTWSAEDDDAWKWRVYIDGQPAERLWPQADPKRPHVKGFPLAASVKDGKVTLVMASQNGIVNVKEPRLRAVRGRVEIRKR